MTMQPRRLRQQAFSLIELMVAMLLGSFVIAGVVTVYQVNLNTAALNQQVSQLQQSEQFSFQLFSKDVQHAGLIGCANIDSSRVVSVVTHANASDQRWTDWRNVPGIRGYEQGAVPQFAGSTLKMASGSDAVQLAFAGGPSSAVVSHVGTEIRLNHNKAALAAKDVVIGCDSRMAAIFRLSKVVAATQTISHEATSNSSAQLGFGANGVNVAQQLSTDAGTVMPLESVAWFVAETGGVTSLYRARYRADQLQTEEIVPDVVSLQLSYLVAGAENYVNGQSSDFNTVATVDWGRVVAVRATLVLKADAKQPLAQSSRTISHVIHLRNH
jgi:type IV pilus assembly protein PilW